MIICDFIDLRFERTAASWKKRLHDNFKNDRAKTKVLRMSQFGIIEMTRQRMRPSLKRSIYFDCPHCKGGGIGQDAGEYEPGRDAPPGDRGLRFRASPAVELTVCRRRRRVRVEQPTRSELTALETGQRPANRRASGC